MRKNTDIPTWTLAHRVHHIETILRRFRRAARALGWRVRLLGQADGEPLLAGEGEGDGPQVYLSTGLHGDEPAGPEALLQWMENGEPARYPFRWSVLPCVNPWGLRHNRRTDASGLDLNRAFHLADHPVIGAVRRWLESRGVPTLALHLHEDYDAQGMYLYELDTLRDPYGPRVLQAASAAVPPDQRKVIEGARARQGWLLRRLRPEFFDEIGWPEAPWLARWGTPRTLTLETPSEFALERRVDAHRLAVTCALQALSSGPSRKRSREDNRT